MAHLAQQQFCESVKAKFPEKFYGVDVLEAGSYDVNGNNRYLFSNYTYTGVDVAPNSNVDVVSVFHQFKPGKLYDLVISTEMLEHDKYWLFSLQHMVNLLKPGGLLVMACAGEGRPEHGTARVNEPNQGNGQQTEDEAWKNYYRNLTAEDIRFALNCEEQFSQYVIDDTTTPEDLYFWGIKRDPAPIPAGATIDTRTIASITC